MHLLENVRNERIYWFTLDSKGSALILKENVRILQEHAGNMKDKEK